jgi:hypothetical protein
LLRSTLSHVGYGLVEGEVVRVGSKKLLALHGESSGERVEISMVGREPQLEALESISLRGLVVLWLAVLSLFREV